MTRRIDQQNRDWTLVWTPENMLHSATAGSANVAFAYDADGMMVQRTENGQTINRLGKLFEHNVTLDSFTKHYQFGGKLIAMREGLSSGSSVSFFATDHLGSTAATIWANGSVRSQLRYDPWGKQRYALNVTPTGYRYTSQRWDSGLGLYDYNARYYDPHIGRFISADVIVPGTSRLTPLTVGFHETMFLEQANEENRQLMQHGPAFGWSTREKHELGTAQGPSIPQNLNRFAYALGNPQSYVDPTGHEWTEVGTITVTLDQLREIIRELGNIEFTLKAESLLILSASALATAVPILLALGLISGTIVGLEGAQVESIKNYLEMALMEARFLNQETIDLIISDVSGEGLWFNWAVVLTTSVTPTDGIYMWGISQMVWRIAATQW